MLKLVTFSTLKLQASFNVRYVKKITQYLEFGKDFLQINKETKSIVINIH